MAELGYVGVLAIELFQVGGSLLGNEMAPRVHNSGHWTIEGARDVAVREPSPSNVASGKREISLGALDTTRDFTFVEDTCRGFLALAGLDGHFGEIFHIGSNFQVSVAELFEKIAGILGVDAKIVTAQERIRPEKSEVFKLQCDNRKLEAAAGFVPSVSLDEGLSRTCRWFSNPENLKKYKGNLYNV